MKSIAKFKKKTELKELLSRITNDNLHYEIDFGKPEGKEIIDNYTNTQQNIPAPEIPKSQ